VISVRKILARMFSFLLNYSATKPRLKEAFESTGSARSPSLRTRRRQMPSKQRTHPTV